MADAGIAEICAVARKSSFDYNEDHSAACFACMVRHWRLVITPNHFGAYAGMRNRRYFCVFSDHRTTAHETRV